MAKAEEYDLGMVLDLRRLVGVDGPSEVVNVCGAFGSRLTRSYFDWFSLTELQTDQLGDGCRRFLDATFSDMASGQSLGAAVESNFFALHSNMNAPIRNVLELGISSMWHGTSTIEMKEDGSLIDMMGFYQQLSYSIVESPEETVSVLARSGSLDELSRASVWLADIFTIAENLKPRDTWDRENWYPLRDEWSGSIDRVLANIVPSVRILRALADSEPLRSLADSEDVRLFVRKEWQISDPKVTRIEFRDSLATTMPLRGVPTWSDIREAFFDPWISAPSIASELDD